jgi:hypothetical protein
MGAQIHTACSDGTPTCRKTSQKGYDTQNTVWETQRFTDWTSNRKRMGSISEQLQRKLSSLFRATFGSFGIMVKKIIDDLEQKSEDYRRIKSWCITKFENTKRKLHKLYEAWKDLGHFLARLREVPDKAEYDHKVESLKTHLKQLHKILTKIISRFFFNIFKSMVQRIAHKLMKWKNNFFI